MFGVSVAVKMKGWEKPESFFYEGLSSAEFYDGFVLADNLLSSCFIEWVDVKEAVE